MALIIYSVGFFSRCCLFVFFAAAARDKPPLNVAPYEVERLLKRPQVDQLGDYLFSGGSLLALVRRRSSWGVFDNDLSLFAVTAYLPPPLTWIFHTVIVFRPRRESSESPARREAKATKEST